jgi:hypothetical protein
MAKGSGTMMPPLALPAVGPPDLYLRMVVVGVVVGEGLRRGCRADQTGSRGRRGVWRRAQKTRRTNGLRIYKQISAPS